MGEQSAVRMWIPTVAMMLVSFVSYVDRTTLALLAPSVLVELHLSAEQYGWAIAAFSVAYTLGNPAWGVLLDRIGVRAGMLLAVALWTIASASHAFVSGLVGLACARAALGFGEGATFPGGLRAATQTLPPSLRSRGVAVAYSGGSLGAILTPLLVTPIAEAWTWRAAFLATGLVGAAWIALWAVLGRGAVHAPSSPAPRSPPAAADVASLVDRRLAAFVALYALGGLPLGAVVYGAPLYLSRALSLTQGQIGALVWLPPLGWEVGYLFWGWVVDARARRGGHAGRAPLALLFVLAALALPLGALRALPGVAAPLAAFVLATFAAGGFIIFGLAHATRAFGTARAGLVAGIGAGSWSAFVALLMPALGHLFDRGAYGAAFAVAALVPSAGVALFVALDRPKG